MQSPVSGSWRQESKGPRCHHRRPHHHQIHLQHSHHHLPRRWQDWMTITSWQHTHILAEQYYYSCMSSNRLISTWGLTMDSHAWFKIRQDTWGFKADVGKSNARTSSLSKFNAFNLDFSALRVNLLKRPTWDKGNRATPHMFSNKTRSSLSYNS